jgi:hypothetical protein
MFLFIFHKGFWVTRFVFMCSTHTLVRLLQAHRRVERSPFPWQHWQLFAAACCSCSS